MSRPQTQRSPRAADSGNNMRLGGRVDYGALSDRRAPRLPASWRERLPYSATYYAQHVAKLTKRNVSGWAQGTCPFRDERNASLSVHVGDARGGWRCIASCGGGDLVGFHMRLTGLSFREAVRSLIGRDVR